MTTLKSLIYPIFLVFMLLGCQDDLNIDCKINIYEWFEWDNGALSNTYGIDIDSDDILDINIKYYRYMNQIASGRGLFIEAINSNYKLIGQITTYLTCRDTIYDSSDGSIDSIISYTSNCLASNPIAQHTEITTPLHLSLLTFSGTEFNETDKIHLWKNGRFYNNNSVLDSNLMTINTYFIDHKSSFSILAELGKFEIIFQDINGRRGVVELEIIEGKTLFISTVRRCL